MADDGKQSLQWGRKCVAMTQEDIEMENQEGI